MTTKNAAPTYAPDQYRATATGRQPAADRAADRLTDHTGGYAAAVGEEYDDPQIDPADLPPPGTEEEFVAMVADLVHAEAPSRFALCAEYGEQVDAEVVGWGLASRHGAFLWGLDRSSGTFGCAERARALYAVLGKVRLVWIDPPVTPEPDDDPTD